MVARLGDLLGREPHLWKERPFRGEATWPSRNPRLADALLGLRDHEIDACEAGLPDAPWPRLPELDAWREALRDATRWPVAGPAPAFHAAATRGVAGHKRAQIAAFARAIGEPSDAPLIEWCSGKGNLARLVSRGSARRVHLVDRDAALLEAGRRAFDREGRAVTTHAQDCALEGAPLPAPHGVALALHACGVLSDRALQAAARLPTQRVLVARCCHHKGNATRALSRDGLACGLTLSPSDLRLSVADEARASARDRARRRRELVMRWAVSDAMRRATGVTRAYVPLPPGVRIDPHAPFAEAARGAVEAAGVALPVGWESATAERRAQQAVRRARALALVRALFRRPLESWLVADRALYLADRGWNVRAYAFCAPSVTPRNLLIDARPT